MKKKFFKVAFIPVVTVVSGINVFNAQKSEMLSDVALANVEALASGEWKDGEAISCMTFIVSPKPDELGLTEYPVAVDCEPCGNLVIAKEASGPTKCTYYNVK